MKFDYCIGNPPYQETIGKTESQSQGNSNWVYHKIANAVDEIAGVSCLIYPFGGWFDSPEALGGFGNKILTDGHTICVYAFEGTSDKRAWFRTDKQPQPLFGEIANLSAGVCVVLRDNKHKHDAYKYSNRVYSDAIVDICKSDIEILTPNPVFIALNKKLGGDRLVTHTKKGLFGIESNFVELNSDMVSYSPDDWEEPILLLTNDKSGSAGRATKFYTDISTIEKGKEYIDLYKVITTSAYPKQKFSSGKPTLDNIKKRAKEIIEVLPAHSAFGRSRMLLFASDRKEDCDNFIKYTQTTFFAGLMLEEPNRRTAIGFVIPYQDFTNSSDIDWSQSIEDIDKQLYAKYNLTESEIAYLSRTEGK